MACQVGCGRRGPEPVAIKDLYPPNKWEGKRLTISGGQVEHLVKDFVHVLDPGRQPDRVDLLCYFNGDKGAVLAKAVRGQEVTVIGKVVGPFDMWALPTMKLEDCEFTLGKAPEGEPVSASKSRGEVDAERDIKAGSLKLRFRHGGRTEAPPWFAAYEKLLKGKDVATDVRPEAGPISGLHPDDREYNRVMTAEIERRHGDGIVATLKKQAEDTAK